MMSHEYHTGNDHEALVNEIELNDELLTMINGGLDGVPGGADDLGGMPGGADGLGGMPGGADGLGGMPGGADGLGGMPGGADGLAGGTPGGANGLGSFSKLLGSVPLLGGLL
ncbi:hypothetical protein [Ktedonobacter robiniae]|uniref:Uncharacterized protein n=1 Tax=Ktedonobacter robiniae TaxID=2778365 RepID=A0ABQ3UR55_9CHLR|nr:hypothetical protein [Ktedonobacter robiniae]GHO54850.1 hypothetical protein KSB_33250 [Ktedonobacter robiniae]